MKQITAILLSVFLLLQAVPMALGAQETPGAGRIATAEGPLNVRKAASTGASVLTTLKKGSLITLISRSGDWWQVEYASGRYGYCHADYISVLDTQTARVATRQDPLSVRSGPGTSYARQSLLPRGSQVVLLSLEGSWSRILYGGTKTGYVSSQYLQQSTGASVRLQVSDWKQTDSRWANVQIGQSGKTMARIGCATTAIAMMESYRTGTVIYPDAMAKKLTYTPSGSVYWPSNYTAITHSSGYLTKIRSLLDSGKPVLFGAKNTYGGQHWVVITGYTGQGQATADFTINDPGSNSRVSLKQFLTDYPNFYKFFHY